MIKEGLWTIELMDGTIIQCTNNDDFKIINQNKEGERGEATSAYERISVIARMKDKTSKGMTRDDLLNQTKPKMSKEHLDDIKYVHKNLMEGLKLPPIKMSKESKTNV